MFKIEHLSAGTPSYPAHLLDLVDPPAALKLKGAALEWSGPRLAIVGARRASAEGCRLAQSLAHELSESSVLIISGGARGIDAAAHRGAVEAARPTWVVLPTTVERPVPLGNRGLFGEVLSQGGALLADAEVAPGKLPFLRRNRLIAALADFVLVVEAEVESGTRHTVEAARSLGRPFGFWSWPPGDPRGLAARSPWSLGGVECPDRSALRVRLGVDPPASPADPLLLALNEGPLTVDQLARALAQPVNLVLSRLFELELAGRVEARGGRYAPT